MKISFVSRSAMVQFGIADTENIEQIDKKYEL